jgi:hypothetical protein
MDTLGFPPAEHPEAPALLSDISARTGGEVDPDVTAFLRRTLHGHELSCDESAVRLIMTWSSDLIEDWSWDETISDEDVARLVMFADNEGDYVYLLDPADHLGFGTRAVYTVEKGSRDFESLTLIARTLEDFLSIYAGTAKPISRGVAELRDEQTAASLPLPRLGNGRELPSDAVRALRFHAKDDILRSVELTRPLDLDGVTFLPNPNRQPWHHHPDLTFYRNGCVSAGIAAGGVVGDVPVEPGSSVSWSSAGELIGFVPSTVVTVRGVPCRPGARVFSKNQTLFVTPDADVDYRGFPCRAGDTIDDYGPGLGLSFTSARAFSFKGRPVPEGVRCTTTMDGGLRFDLVAPLVLDGRTLSPGAHVWYDFQGGIREIYERPLPP